MVMSLEETTLSDASATKRTLDNDSNGDIKDGQSPSKKQRLDQDQDASNGNAPAPATTATPTSTMVPAPAPPTEPDMNNLPKNPMPPHQKKHALTSIKAVKRLKDAAPFLHPVDVVKLNIPFYYNYIKRPMDLSTIERKINANAYERHDQVSDDFNLMVKNCHLFNGKDSAISQMVNNIQASFEKHFLNMPPKDLPPQPASKAKRKSTSSDFPKIRRESAVDGRPKREIHPPKPKDMPYDIRPKKKKFQAELRFAQQTLKDLTSKKYDSFSFPFLLPVDPVALDCPTYFQIVKEPMDLGTVGTKLQNGEYENADQFERDVRLVFQNCYAFNPEGTPVNMMGHRLEDAFNEKWAKKPATPATPPSLSDFESDDEAEEEFNVDINSITDPTIEFLVANIERMTADLKKMRQDKYSDMKKEWAKKKKYRHGKKGKRRSKSGASSNGSLYPMQVTYDMKKEISDAMNSINDKMLKNVIAIIKEGVPDLGDDEEIELDMDQLNDSTLLKLYNYIKGGAKSKGKKKSKSSSSAAHSSSLSATSEEKQIENLKKRLELFETAENGDAEESSDEDDEDDVSSEEE